MSHVHPPPLWLQVADLDLQLFVRLSLRFRSASLLLLPPQELLVHRQKLEGPRCPGTTATSPIYWCSEIHCQRRNRGLFQTATIFSLCWFWWFWYVLITFPQTLLLAQKLFSSCFMQFDVQSKLVGSLPPVLFVDSSANKRTILCHTHKVKSTRNKIGNVLIVFWLSRFPSLVFAVVFICCLYM